MRLQALFYYKATRFVYKSRKDSLVSFGPYPNDDRTLSNRSLSKQQNCDCFDFLFYPYTPNIIY